MSQIRLLSTDFDGTLIGGKWGDVCALALSRELKGAVSRGAIWAVNTGRSLESALEGLDRFGAPIKPDYLLTNERHVFHPDGRGGWNDYGEWNRLCREHHDRLFAASGKFFEGVARLLQNYPGVILQEGLAGVPEGLIAQSEEQLDAVAQELDSLPGKHHDFHYQRSNIYLRFCHRLYDKGTALAELSRLLDMPTEEILAVGDHQNDLAMLYGQVAGMVACPSNAHPLVQEAVRSAGGYVSSLEAGEGTADAIRFYAAKESKLAPNLLP